MIFFRALRRVLFAIVMFAVSGLVLASYYFDYLFPFDLAREPNLFTKFHLSSLEAEPARCFAALDRANISYRRVPPVDREEGCGYADAVEIRRAGVSYGGGVTLRCPAMLALLLWERHVLVPAARTHLDSAPASVRHLGTYACRPVRGRRALSQHAFANAIDISVVALEGGETVSVLRDWDNDSEKGRFLRALRAGACEIFSATLSPDYNAAHANHFHFDRGRWRTCR